MKPKLLFAGSSKSRLMPALAVALSTITTGHAQNLLVTGGLTEPATGTYTYSATSGDSGIRNGGTFKVNTGVGVTVNNGGNSWIGIGDGNGSSLLWLNGGSMTINSNWGTVLGRTANGTITIDSGSLTVNKGQGATDNALIISEGSATGTVNLNGTGTLTTYKITSTGGNTSQVFNFDGGTLKPTVSKADWFANNGNILTQVRNGGAKIDTAGFDVTIGEQLVHSTLGGDNAIDGGLSKEGGGILTLSAANTFTGAVVVNGGTLLASTINSAASGAFSEASSITVNNGAILQSGTNSLFGFNGTKVKDITVNTGGVLTMNDGSDVNVGNITLAGGTLAAIGTNHAGFGSWVLRHNSVLSVTENSTVSASNVLLNNGSSINVAAGKTLNFTGTLTNTSANGNGVLIKTGAGGIDLSGINSYSGGTTLTSGTLAAGNNSAFGIGAVQVNGGTLTNIGIRTITNAISGAGGNIAAAALTEFNVNGNISGNGSFGLSGILGSGGLFLGGDNSGFTGTFTVTGANSRLNSANAGSAAAKWVVDGNLQLNVAGATTYHLGELSSTVSTGGISGHATNASSTVSTLSVGALNNSSEFKGVIANMPANNAATGNVDGASNNVLALTKVGNGALTLSGASTYSGGTIVSAGTLLVSGSLGDTAVTVNSGAKLGGSGAVGTGTVLNTLIVNGELSPGNSAGILTVNDNLDLNGALTMELNGITAGSSYDQVVLNGAGELGGNLSWMWGLTSAPAINTELLLILNDGSDAFAGAFTNAANLSNHIDNLGGSWQLRYSGGDGNDLSLVAIPEPRAALLGGLGLLALLRRRRH